VRLRGHAPTPVPPRIYSMRPSSHVTGFHLGLLSGGGGVIAELKGGKDYIVILDHDV
jgi:hypothetical protein